MRTSAIRHRTTWRRLSAGLIAAALVTAACGGDDDAADVEDPPTEDTAEPDDDAIEPDDDAVEPDDDAPDVPDADTAVCTEDRIGGSMTVDTGSPLSGLDPFLLFGTGTVGGDAAGAVYDTVMRYDAPTQTFRPHIAESLEPNDDNTVWTLRIRDDVAFGNGDPYTTEHIAAHIERLKESVVRAAGMAALVDDIEIVDDHEMVVTLTTSFNFPYMMATELGWVPNSNLVEERGDEFHINPAGAGAGPYEVERISETAGEEILLTAKDDYWGGPVCIQELRFIHIPGAQSSFDAFNNRETDTYFVNNIRHASQLEADGLLPYAAPAGGINYVLGDQGITGSGETAFNDVRVREAMQLAIDYDAVNERLFDNLTPRSTSAIVPEESPIFHGMEGPPYDPERAAELVAETIADGTWDGSFVFIHEGTTEATDQAVLLQGLWNAVGMDVELEVVPSVPGRVIAERNFEVATNGFVVLDPVPWSTLNGLQCGNVRQRSGFCDPDMDAAIDELRAAITIEEIQEALRGMQEVWNETFPVIMLTHGVWAIGAQEHVHGLQFGPDNTPYYETAWVEQ